MIIWITGISGSGKTTIARELISMFKIFFPEMAKLDADYFSCLEVKKIGLGVFSHLSRFMDEKYFYSLVENMRLSNGLIFALPLELSVAEHKIRDLKELFN